MMMMMQKPRTHFSKLLRRRRLTLLDFDKKASTRSKQTNVTIDQIWPNGESEFNQSRLFGNLTYQDNSIPASDDRAIMTSNCKHSQSCATSRAAGRYKILPHPAGKCTTTYFRWEHFQSRTFIFPTSPSAWSFRLHKKKSNSELLPTRRYWKEIELRTCCRRHGGGVAWQIPLAPALDVLLSSCLRRRMDELNHEGFSRFRKFQDI